MKQPCLVCDELTDNGSRCEAHAVVDNRLSERTRQRAAARGSSTRQGYDSQWQRLSRRARALQPFCVDCGSTTDLQADHTPEAWQRKAAGKTIRLQDIDVVCGSCNRARGAARGAGARSSRDGRSRPAR